MSEITKFVEFACPLYPFDSTVSVECMVFPKVPLDQPSMKIRAKDMIDFGLTYDNVDDLSVKPPPANPFYVYIQPIPQPAPDYVTVKDVASPVNFDRLVGVALDGVPIYTALDSEGKDVFSSIAGSSKQPFRINKCGGSYGLTPSGWRYHYRFFPACLLDGTSSRTKLAEYVDSPFELLDAYADLREPIVIGYSLAGYPIYSPLDSRGLQHTGLDNCNGKFVNGSYGYYASPLFPYISGCEGPGVYTATELKLYKETASSKAGQSYVPCPRGTFPASSASGVNSPNGGCIPCPMGKYSTRVSNNEHAACNMICPAGSYCPIGSTKPILCAGGKFGSTTGLGTSDCSGPCAEGYFCPPGSRRPDAFPCGNITFYCPAGTSTRYAVDEGYFTVPVASSPSLRSGQVLCGPGTLCKLGVQYSCPAGSYGPAAGSNCVDVCPRGHFCPEGSVQPKPCPAGRFGATERLTTEYCSGLCAPGYFCPVGSTTPFQHPCPAGRYGAESGLISEECSPLCEPGGAPNVTSPVATRFCKARVCAEGYICPLASTSPKQRECGGPDVFCPPGSVIPTNVAVGYYSIGQLSSSDVQSPADETTRTGQVQCEPGYWCQGGLKFPCAQGYFGSTPGLSSQYCSGICAPGFICPETSTSARQRPCGQNSSVYCPEASFVPKVVPPGFYAVNGSDTTRSAILRCPMGMYCTDGVKKPCPAGRFSPAGSTSESCEGLCAAGYYCPKKSTSPIQIPCPAGRFGQAGSVDSRCTGACLRGYYCPLHSTTPYEKECGGEYVYCPHGSANPLSVSRFHYSTGGNATTRFAQAPCRTDTQYTGTPPASDSRFNVCPSTTVL